MKRRNVAHKIEHLNKPFFVFICYASFIYINDLLLTNYALICDNFLLILILTYSIIEYSQLE